ncbi:MAG: hypothetical protein HQL07_17400 [Nitrospirae bacterium]|nr:hypothetical protein [Magnetococcales bacterium]
MTGHYRSFKIYLLTFFAGMVLSWVGILLLTPMLSDVPRLGRELVKTIREQNPDMVLFGDSVMRATRKKKCDTGSATIDELLTAALPNTRLAASPYTSSTPLVFNDLLSVTTGIESPPKIIIVPINLRSYSEEWSSRPSYQYNLERALIRIKFGDSHPFDYFLVWMYRFTKALDLEMEAWRNQTVVYPGYDLGPRRKLHDERMTLPKNLECVPHKKEQFRDVLRIKFIYHYLYRLDPSHQFVQSLIEMIHKTRRFNQKILVYITPINMQDGERFVGPAFRRIVLENVQVIQTLMTDMGVPFLNMVDQLPPEHFTDQHEACEHLDETGRRFVAGQLAQVLREEPFNRK